MGYSTGKACRWLLNALLPRACAHCGEDLHYLAAAPLCAACEAALERPAGPLCRVCGLPLPYGGARCPDCRGGDLGALALARSAFVFNPQLRSLVHALKYRGRDDLAGWLSAEMAAALARLPELAPYNFCAEVPLHPARRRERGYNQSELLAAGVAARADLFHLRGAAERGRDTPSQTALSRERRRENMAGAFSAPAPELVRGRNVLLIDDVATTMATLRELAGELKKAGAASVAAFTLAREP